MKTKSIWILTIISLILLVSCSGSTDDNNDDISILAVIDITNSNSLYIAPSAASEGANRTTGDSSQNRLFKITEDGYILEVTYMAEGGSSYSESLVPTDLYNVDDSYIIISFSSIGYLVRKSDGAVFSLENVGVPHVQLQHGNFKNSKRIQLDSAGNIYYQTSPSLAADTVKVIKIDITNPDNLIKTDYSPSSDIINGFNITPSSHMAYNYSDGSYNRVKKSNGGIYNLPSTTWLAHWIGIDGNIKYQKSDISPGTVVTLNIDSNDYSVSTSEVSGSLDFIQSSSSYILSFTSSTIIVEVANEYINEVENTSNTPRKISINEIADIKLAGQSIDYYYLSGNDVSGNPLLLKIDPNTDSVTTLLSPGLYDIYSFTVSSDNVVTFNALRMSDGIKIIGDISSTGVFTLLDEEQNSEVVTLERIK